MSLINLEAFNDYADGTDFYAIAPGWQNGLGGVPLINTTGQKDGRACLSTQGIPQYFFVPGGASGFRAGRVCFSFWYRYSGALAPNQDLLCILNGSNTAFYVRNWTNGNIDFHHFSFGWMSSPSVKALAPDTWYFMEIRARFNASINQNDCIIRVNEEEWINLPAGTNTSWNQGINGIQLWGVEDSAGVTEILWDSLAVYDDEGPLGDWNASTFVGTHRFRNRPPTGNGTTNQWTNELGNSTNNYASIADQPNDGDTTYIGSTTPGQVDLHSHDPVTGTDDIRAVQVKHLGKRLVAQTTQINPVARVSGANYPAPGVELKDDYEAFSHIWEKNPATGDKWTLAEINAAELGLELNP